MQKLFTPSTFQFFWQICVYFLSMWVQTIDVMGIKNKVSIIENPVRDCEKRVAYGGWR